MHMMNQIPGPQRNFTGASTPPKFNGFLSPFLPEPIQEELERQRMERRAARGLYSDGGDIFSRGFDALSRTASRFSFSFFSQYLPHQLQKRWREDRDL